MKLWVGTSGYSYKPWLGNFYPERLAAKEMLRFYAARLPAVEINNTFYRLPKETVLQTWAEQVPAEFRFVLKAPQRITHVKRLKDAAAEVDNQSGMRAVLVRDGDYFVSHRKRMEIAHEARADFFISIHADSYRDPNAKGATVYMLSEKGASDEAALLLAQRENGSDLIGGASLADKDQMLARVLLDLALSSGPVVVRVAATQAIVKSNRRASRPAVRVALSAKEPELRAAAFLALRELEKDQPLVAIRAGLAVSYEDVRVKAIEAVVPIARTSITTPFGAHAGSGRSS